LLFPVLNLRAAGQIFIKYCYVRSNSFPSGDKSSVNCTCRHI